MYGIDGVHKHGITTLHCYGMACMVCIALHGITNFECNNHEKRMQFNNSKGLIIKNVN